MMTEHIVVALIAGVPPTLAAILAFVQARHARKTAVALEVKTEVIHKAVNSNLDAVKADLVLANQRIAALVRALEQKGTT